MSEIEFYSGSRGSLGTLSSLRAIYWNSFLLFGWSQWLRPRQIISLPRGCVAQILCHCEWFDSCFLLVSVSRVIVRVPIDCVFAAVPTPIIRLEQPIEDVQLLLCIFSGFQAVTNGPLVACLLPQHLCSACLLRLESQLRYIS